MSEDRLSAIEAGYVSLERDGLPLHIGALGTFEAGPLLDPSGRLRLEEIRGQVAARLELVPRLRQRIAPTPLGVARPVWVDDPDFDIADHVDAVRLPPGAGDEDLRLLAEELLGQPLPPDRPRWHLRFVEGLDGRIGLVERVHHALVDGVGGVELALLLLDPTPEVAPVAPVAWSPTPAPSPAVRLAQGLAEQAVAAPRAVGTLLAGATRPARAAAAARHVGGAVLAAVRDGLVAPRWDLNVAVDEGRLLRWCRVPLAAVKAVGREHGATVNDVVLAAVAHGLRGEELALGHRVGPGRQLKVLVPVSVRRPEAGAVGNQVGALLVPLPIGLGDPVARLRAVAATTRRLKAEGEVDAALLLLALADLAPAPLVAPAARLTNSQRLVNTVVTNVPGPATPLYCRGARMLEAVPFVPLGGNMSVEVAVLSYDDAVTVSLTADRRHGRDAELLCRGIEEGFAALGVDSGH